MAEAKAGMTKARTGTAEPTEAKAAGRELAIPAAAAEGGTLALDLIREKTGAARFMQITRPPEYDGGDVEVESQCYALALLTQERREEILKQDLLSTKDILALLRTNSPARTFDAQVYLIEGDLIKEIDVRIREPVFIADGTRVYTREELMETYPFEALGVEPEEVFAQQELGVFPGRLNPTHEEFIVRDLGDESVFQVPEDMVRKTDTRMVKRMVKTKIFLARDGWEDFITTVKQLRAMMRFGQKATARANRTGQANMFALMARTMVAGATGPLALESSDEREARLKRQEEELKRREERLKQLEKEAEDLISMLDGINISGEQ